MTADELLIKSAPPPTLDETLDESTEPHALAEGFAMMVKDSASTVDELLIGSVPPPTLDVAIAMAKDSALTLGDEPIFVSVPLVEAAGSCRTSCLRTI